MRNDNMAKMINAIKTPEDGYRVLAYAIIAMAAYDYRKARVQHDRMKIQTLERFFRGRYFAMFGRGRVNGEYIIDQLKRESIEEVQRRLYGNVLNGLEDEWRNTSR